MSDAVLLEVEDHVATLRLNREENRNAMTSEVLGGFRARIDEVRRNPDVRAVIVTGTGKHFCSGADFRGPESLLARGEIEGQAALRDATRAMYEAFLQVLDIEVPVIAAVNGHAVGGGFGLALVCDIRIVSERAKLGANFVRLGIHPGMGITWLLPRLVGPERAAELLFTGRLLDGAEAAEMGLAAYAVPEAQVHGKALDLARQVASAAPYAVRTTKRTVRDLLAWDPRPAAEREAFAQSLCFGMEDAREGVAALLAKRDPVFRGK